MRINKIASTCILLISLLLSFMLPSCKETDPPITPVNIIEGETAIFTIVRPVKASKNCIKAAIDLKAAIDSLSGVPIGISDDWAKNVEDIDRSAYEILVGETNREESKSAYEKLVYGYSIEVTENKVIIAASNDYFLELAVARLVSEMKSENKNIFLLLGTSINIVFDESNSFSILENGVSNSIIIISKKASPIIEAALASLLNTIRDLTGINIEYTYDTATQKTEGKNEILIGETGRVESKNVIKGLADYEYAIQIKDGVVVIAGTGDELTAKAVGIFCEKLKRLATRNKENEAMLIIPNADDVGSIEGWTTDIPEYKGGEQDKIFDCNDNQYLRLIRNTNKTEFISYQDSLVEKGYTKVYENSIGENLYTAYLNSDSSLYVYYIDKQKSVRIVAGGKSAFDFLTEENQYTKTTDSTLTQLQLQSLGLSAVYKLCDGRFLVIDGGPGDGGGKEVAELYRVLSEQTPQGDKIVIAAWIFTHAHPDHINVFMDFMPKHNQDVKVEKVIFNFPSLESTRIVDSNMSDNIVPKFYDIIKIFFRDDQLVKPYAGQVFNIANAKIEFLYTYADLFPSYYEYYNDSTAVFTVDIEGQRHMWLGDIMPKGNGVMAEMYDDYLKSDLVQMSHHGIISGGTTQVYRLIDPTICLWPTSVEHYDEYKDHTINKSLVEGKNVKAVIISHQGTYTMKLPYMPS